MENLQASQGKYLTFHLGSEEYGIAILKVKEIIGMMEITEVPQTKDYIKGVINLRGKVIPVFDLRTRFEMAAAEYTERTCIVVVEIQGKKGIMSIGMVVDAVSEVVNIKGEDIEETPALGTQVNASYIQGMAKNDGRVKILLDIDQVLGQDDLAALEQAA